MGFLPDKCELYLTLCVSRLCAGAFVSYIAAVAALNRITIRLTDNGLSFHSVLRTLLCLLIMRLCSFHVLRFLCACSRCVEAVFDR